MKAIVATSKNGIIGDNGKIPWHCPEDLRWFKEFTWGKRLIVGRKTWDSLPDLKHRMFAVITNNLCLLNHYDGNYFFENNLAWEYLQVDYVKNLIKYEKNFEHSDIILAGGAKTYETFLPYVDEFYQTVVDVECEGDTKLPFQFSDHFSKVEVHRILSEKAVVYKWTK